jgi:hypothetical protein
MAKDERDSRAAVPLLRDKVEHSEAEQHAVERFRHQDNQPPANERALIARIGVRHSVKASKPLRTPADAPAAASPRGTTQQDEAMMAVRPEASPTAPNQLVDRIRAVSGAAFCSMFPLALGICRYHAPRSGYRCKREHSYEPHNRDARNGGRREA